MKNRHYLCRECTTVAASDPEHFHIKGKGIAFGACTWCGHCDTEPRTIVLSKEEEE